MALKTADVGYLTRRLDTGFLFNLWADLVRGKKTADVGYLTRRLDSGFLFNLVADFYIYMA